MFLAHLTAFKRTEYGAQAGLSTIRAESVGAGRRWVAASRPARYRCGEMNDERAPTEAWLEFTLALTRATGLSGVQAALAGPLAAQAGVSATLTVPPGAPADGLLLPRQGEPVAALHLGATPARQALALTHLIDLQLRAHAPRPLPAPESGDLRAYLQATRHLTAELDFTALNERVDQLLRDLLPGVTSSVLECLGTRWAVRFVSERAALSVQAPVPQGLLVDVPALRDAEERVGAPLFIDDWDAAAQQLPASAAYHAAALQAFEGPEWPVTILAAGCRERRCWTAEERDVFTGVARAYGEALTRVARAHQLVVERATLRALVEFKERAAHSRNIGDLSGQAALVLRQLLDRVTVGYLVREASGWRATTLLGDLPERLAARLRAGAPLEHEVLDAAFATGEAQFVPRQTTPPSVPGVDAFGALAVYPVTEQRQAAGLLVMGTQRAPDWTERERSVFRAVGRSLAQAFDREVRERRLAQQHAELQAQARSLQAFAQLSADLGAQEDRVALVRRAQEVALSLLPPGFAVYYEPEGERLWHLRSQVGSLRNEALQAVVDAGLDFHDSQNLLIPWRTGQPYYQSQYDPATDRLDATRDVVGASATIPLRQAGELIGVFAVGQYEPHPWAPGNRALLEGVTRSLQLALDRAASLAELRRTTQETARSNAALQAANEELEAFAYSVSHDLRAPVRHIAGFADLLRRALGPLDSQPKAARYLNIIAESAAQMNALIDAMLALSRVTRQELHLTDVDLNALVSGVRATLAPELQGRAVTIQVAPLPTVQADAALLRQVMTNLLSNAVKYTAPCQDAQIQVWADAAPDAWTVRVRDNGVGFDPAYAHKLFGVFQRLHRAEEFSGTGVGLANVRRIVQRHGGSVQAESQPGGGATFSFRLPRQV